MDRSAAFRIGVNRALPLGLAGLPFGLVYGAAVADSAVSSGLGLAGSWIVLAGAAQLTLVDLIDSDARWFVAIGAALLINARFALYSAAMGPALRDQPVLWRFGLPYLMTDQAASLSIEWFEEQDDPVLRRWFFLGAGLCFASGWWIGSTVGVLSGAALPESLDISFAIPAMFIALLVPALRSGRALRVAVVAGVVTVLAAPLPTGANVLVGAAAGLAVAGREEAS